MDYKAPEVHHLSKFLGAPNTILLEIPYYQRGYDWEEKNIDDFWDDLIEADTPGSKDHFFGFVYTEELKQLGGIDQIYKIVDGQQRLTTCFLLLICMRDLCFTRAEWNNNFNNLTLCQHVDRKNKDGTVEQKLQLKKYDVTNCPIDRSQGCNGHCIIKVDNIIEDIEKIIFLWDKKTSKPDPKRPFLKLSRTNWSFFENYVLPAGNPRLKYSKMLQQYPNDSCEKLTKRYKRLTDLLAIKIFKGRHDYQNLSRLISSLTQKFTIYQVPTDEDNAYQMFDTINNRGTGLQTQDLVKHRIFSFLNKEFSSFSVHEKNNKLDEYDEIWNSIRNTITGKDQADYEMENFLHHYLVVFVNKDIKLKKVFETIQKILKGDPKIMPIPKPASELLKELKKWAEIFQILRNPGIHFDPKNNPDIKWYLETIKRFNSQTVYHVIFAAYEKFWSVRDKKTFKETLSLAHRNFVRNKTVGSIGASPMEDKYKEVANGIIEKNWKIAEIKKAFISNPSVYETPESIQLSLSEIKNWSKNSVLTRYVLEEINNTMGTGYYPPPDITNEHIMSQTLDKGNKWKKYIRNKMKISGTGIDGKISEYHTRNVNKLGNITLLSKELNTSLKQDLFSKKVVEYQTDQYAITKNLDRYTEWTEKEIDNRTNDLLKKIEEILDITISITKISRFKYS